MRPRPGGWIAGVLAVSFLAGACTRAQKTMPAEIAWNRGIDVALTDAQARHRPILLDFYTDW